MSYSKKLASLQKSLLLPSPTQPVNLDWLPSNFRLYIKRDDLIHPIISGNKWRKLKYQLINNNSSSPKAIASFGGPHSNHLHALAYCCQFLDVKFYAFVRGNNHKYLSHMLQDIYEWNAEVVYLDYSEYKQRSAPSFLKNLKQTYNQCAFIAEGGTGKLALQGVQELIAEQQQSYDHVFVPVGSGGTLAGLATANHSAQVHGVCVLKGAEYLNGVIKQLIGSQDSTNWKIHHQFHHGGYAKSTPELSAFCDDFYQQTQIKLEPVYSGKLFFALKQLLTSSSELDKETPQSILAIHTGGLQGARDKQ